MCFLWVDGPHLQNVDWLQLSNCLLSLQHSIFWFGPIHFQPSIDCSVQVDARTVTPDTSADARTVTPDTSTAPSDSKLFPYLSWSSTLVCLCSLECPQIHFCIRSLLVWIYNPKSWSPWLRVCWKASLCLWVRGYGHFEKKDPSAFFFNVMQAIHVRRLVPWK